MRDVGIAAAAYLMGWATWPLMPHVRDAWLWLLHQRNNPPQWFTRSDAAQVTPTLPPRPQPGPRPVVGQRPSEGGHRAKQRQARFGGRSFRSRR